MNLLKKAEIADNVLLHRLDATELMKKYNITKFCANNILHNLHSLTKFFKTDPSFKGRYNLSSCETKYLDVELFIRERIKKTYRKKLVVVNSNVIEEIANMFYKEK
ncbi:hypothetical protein DMUE_5007 [Dictyocoela muelleri]|nr:hypothetical protein DMUE_5007 [Dictyocoela muelleri]